MALRHADSWDYYASVDANQLTDHWTQWSGNGGIIVGAGRNGTDAFSTGSSGNAMGYLLKTLTSQQTWILGAAINLQGTLQTRVLFSLLDVADEQITLRVRADNILEVLRSDNVVLGTGTHALSEFNWWYVEMKVTIDNAVGAIEVRVNQVADISLSGIDTQATANATANVVAFGKKTFAGSQLYYIDDFYACDSAGAVNNDFLGDVRVQALFPAVDGTTIQFTPSVAGPVGTVNSVNIDDNPPNDDVDYNFSSTPGQKDTFQFGNMTAATALIKGVITQVYARKDDAGIRTIAPVIRHSGTDYDGSNQNINTDYTYFEQIYETNPGTGLAWTVADVNAAEFGYKLIA